ncbi:MAG: DNA-binding protein [Bilophila wadsworthia]
MFPALQRFLAVECRTQAELAEFLGIKQSSISDAKKEKRFLQIGFSLRCGKGIRPDWILTGQGAYAAILRWDGNGCPPACTHFEIRPPEECTMEELMVEIFRRASKTINKNKLH